MKILLYISLFFILPCFQCLLNAASFRDELLSPLISANAKYPFFIGTALSGTMMTFGREESMRLEHRIRDHKPLGKTSIYGNILGQLVPNGAYIVTMGGLSLLKKDDLLQENALLMLKATAYAGAVVTFLKYTVREKRPDPSQSRVSFPSGHTAMAFAFASTVGAIHGVTYAIPAYLMATFVGISRINDNAHWPHDVLAGATLGISYGLGIVDVNKKEKEGTKETTLSLTPLFFPTGGGLLASYSW